MRSRSFVAVALKIAVVFGGAPGLLAYDSSKNDVIANGITVGGIDIGGLSVAQARARLRSQYADPREHRPSGAVLARCGRSARANRRAHARSARA